MSLAGLPDLVRATPERTRTGHIVRPNPPRGEPPLGRPVEASKTESLRRIENRRLEPCGDPDCYRRHNWDNGTVRAHCPGMVHWCGEPGCDGVCEDLGCEGEPKVRRALTRARRWRSPWWVRLLRWFEEMLG